MENFFYDDRFCGDLSDLMDVFDIEEPKNLKDDWTCKVEMSELEPCIKLNAKKLLEILINENEERFGENFDASDEDKIMKCLTDSIDFDKLKDLMPKYYYPQSKFKVVTKQDLIDYCA